MSDTGEIKIESLVQGKADSSKDEIKRLRSKHPVYIEFEPEWQKQEEFYNGGDCVRSSKYIFKHHREDEHEFGDRVKRAHFANYTALVVDFFSNFIFSETINRDGGKNAEFYSTFIKDVDKRGNEIDQFMRRVSTRTQVYGMCYVLVESPRIPEGTVITKAQEEEQGLRPYWVLINPDEILDWDHDEFGSFTYVKRCQKYYKRMDGVLKNFEKYTEWDKDTITITIVDVTKSNRPFISGTAESIPNKLGEVPIIAAPYQESIKCPYMGESFVKDIVTINQAVLNKTSLIDEFLYRQCFNFLAVQTSGSLVTQSEDEGDVGTSTLWEYPVGAERPAYVTPPVDPAKFLQEERQYLIKTIFELASQNLNSDFANGEKSSGFSQAQSFAKTVPFIAQRGDSLEAIENKAMRLTMKYKNSEWNGTVKYKDRYEQTNVMDAISQLQAAFKDLAMPSKTFAKAELKRVVREVDGKLSPDQMDEIVTEIDTAVDSDEKFKEWQVKVMSKNGSPAAQNKPKTSGTMAEVKAEAKIPNTRATKPLPSNTK